MRNGLVQAPERFGADPGPEARAERRRQAVVLVQVQDAAARGNVEEVKRLAATL